MSTRAHIRLIEGSYQIRLYRHSDGYEEGCGADLKSIVEKEGFGDIEYLAAHIVRIDLDDRVPSFVPAICVHGDEEYFWVVDCDKEEIRFGDSEGTETTIYFKKGALTPPATDKAQEGGA